MLNLLGAIIIGFLVGLLAKIIMRIRAGFIVTTLMGIGGSLVATYLGQYLNFYAVGQAAGFIGSTVGAILIIAIYKFIRES